MYMYNYMYVRSKRWVGILITLLKGAAERRLCMGMKWGRTSLGLTQTKIWKVLMRR